MGEPVSFSREVWHSADHTICSIASVDGMLEVSLRDEQGLIALCPCHDYFEASAIAAEWQIHPPKRWPDEAALD